MGQAFQITEAGRAAGWDQNPDPAIAKWIQDNINYQAGLAQVQEMRARSYSSSTDDQGQILSQTVDPVILEAAEKMAAEVQNSKPPELQYVLDPNKKYFSPTYQALADFYGKNNVINDGSDNSTGQTVIDPNYAAFTLAADKNQQEELQQGLFYSHDSNNGAKIAGQAMGILGTIAGTVMGGPMLGGAMGGVVGSVTSNPNADPSLGKMLKGGAMGAATGLVGGQIAQGAGQLVGNAIGGAPTSGVLSLGDLITTSGTTAGDITAAGYTAGQAMTANGLFLT